MKNKILIIVIAILALLCIGIFSITIKSVEEIEIDKTNYGCFRIYADDYCSTLEISKNISQAYSVDKDKFNCLIKDNPREKEAQTTQNFYFLEEEILNCNG